MGQQETGAWQLCRIRLADLQLCHVDAKYPDKRRVNPQR
jgi:hypothetical protein